MRHVGIGEQQVLVPRFRADGSITAGGTPQLILPHAAPRSSILLQNNSDTVMMFEFGCARATAAISSGVVTSCTVTNAGFGFTYAPIIQFIGGGRDGNGRNLGVGYPGQKAPSNFATAHCVMASDGLGGSGLKVNSIVIDNGGALYATAPYVQLMNDPNDAFGCAIPSATVGFQLYPGQSLYEAHSVVTTDSIAVYCATTAKTYFCGFTT